MPRSPSIIPDSTNRDVYLVLDDFGSLGEIAAASSTGRPLVVLKASSGVEIEAAFASAIERPVRALVISADPFFMAQRAQIVGLAADHKFLVIYAFREFVDDGGLMSYGPSLASAYRQAGIYAGRILKGAKPSCQFKGR